MEAREANMSTQRSMAKRLAVWMIVVVAILMIPLLANAPWTFGDFVFAGIVLSACAAVYEYATRNMSSVKQRAAVAAAVLFFIFLVIGWAATGP
jgi:predicted PurR-regulated permease PerM